MYGTAQYSVFQEFPVPVAHAPKGPPVLKSHAASAGVSPAHRSVRHVP